MHRETLWSNYGDGFIDQRSKPSKVKKEKRAIVKKLTSIKPVPLDSNEPSVYCPQCGLYYRRCDTVDSAVTLTRVCLICDFITKG